ncbi:L-aminopeptidase/D-esterase [Pseudobutyrivibrio sp. YE44]|uniref:P1 family peptidase n=1 Tax=Pseudobutyrivibrio sp. YE44 TaxID=1520802 RepID=UPI00089067C9|nr:P1 family peptidase [Pseudobutyrivibrio sp. YE44]SDB40899.1 L-aminopeptidase/D-esterase [Pseudobutyrivibrio sp. YE44]
MGIKEIKLSEIGDFKIGQAENKEAATGVTVIVAPQGAPVGLDIRGGGPASRESGLMDPLAAAEIVHGVVLGGGSAFGLDAAGGVMKYLSEHGIGFPVGDVVVPLVCQSDIFDLGIGRSDVYPDKEMGYQAAKNAFEIGDFGNYKDGDFGCGCGATVGKILGMERCTKTGVGSYAVQLGELKVGAIVCTNAIGDIYDYETGKRIAGIMSEDGKSMNDLSCEDILLSMAESPAATQNDTKPVTNTTIGIVITNASFNKTQLCKLAGMTHDGYARCIRPIHTSMDGDSIYAMSVGQVESTLDIVGTLANQVMCEAIRRTVK